MERKMIACKYLFGLISLPFTFQLSYCMSQFNNNLYLHYSYPSDPKTRAVINQRLYFDACTLYQKFSEYYYPQIFKKEPADPAKLKIMETAVEFLDTFLEGQKYAAGGDTLTLADLSLVATIATYEVAAFDLSKYANIKRWYAMCKTEVKGFQINHDGAQIFGDYFK